MRVEASQRWVRAVVGNTTVVDSHAPLLFWEDTFPVPSYAFSRDDVRMDLLVLTGQAPTSGNRFFVPKGPVSEWFDLHVDGKVFASAAWIRDDPAVRDRIVFSWQSSIMDRWLEEDEQVHSHPRDPFKRVDALVSSRHVTVALDGITLADSRQPVLLFETHAPIRYYLPRSDVRLESLSRSANRSHCPYKGFAEEYWDAPGAPGVAWSYPQPYPAVAAIADRIAFYNELVDTTVDGVLLPRPDSPFSLAQNRPTSV